MIFPFFFSFLLVQHVEEITSLVSVIPRLISMYSFSSRGMLGCSEGESFSNK